ncbi:hypothetical protein IWW57_003170 [Coemansia sp. S610]|uniref:Uncharacterized protein n=1 Tax=Coemansia linderi TaxID=2663919 RepID=A0ACC1JXL6_9FUNG|nr:hypothetical protein LPJ60_003017 [Coemansia sp. RSA 2675]KAJ2026031.1 hypothetical protein IWW57_003170 [Coemansia sp. S610]KAJ2697390.1 hypothetical protein H4218_003977 [Coemansia sp. IMI 209128]KAJ2769051.1 hypothetical protein GGI18_005471 [Coemansia linderi]
MDEMDPFEARLLFGNMLENLTGAQPTIDRVSGFALKHTSMADDLLDCIADKLDKLQVPPRLNLLFVVDAILLSANRNSLQTWAELIKKNIVATVTAVIPETPGGDSNVPQVRKVVSGWKRKSIFDTEVLDKLDKLLSKRSGGASTESGMRHEDILKRIEEDRERHKRHKEDVWIRPAGELPENELELYWETASDFNDADWQDIAVENEEYQQERHLADIVKRSI